MVPEAAISCAPMRAGSVDVLSRGQSDTEGRQYAGPGDQDNGAGAWRDQVIGPEAMSASEARLA